MNTHDFSNLTAVFINCTLKKSPQESHTQRLLDVSSRIMEKEGAQVDHIRLVDHDVPPGVQPDMTEQGYHKDEWPQLFEQIIKADILVIGTPIWLGEKSSVSKILIERLYAHSSEMNDKGQYKFYGRVGGCLVTGNEDGIKHCSRDLLYALQHIGYSIPPQADTGWIGKVGPGPSYMDEGTDSANNDFTNQTVTFMTYNLLHLASILKANKGYPAYGNSQKAWQDGKRWEFEKSTDYISQN